MRPHIGHFKCSIITAHNLQQNMVVRFMKICRLIAATAWNDHIYVHVKKREANIGDVRMISSSRICRPSSSSSSSSLLSFIRSTKYRLYRRRRCVGKIINISGVWASFSYTMMATATSRQTQSTPPQQSSHFMNVFSMADVPYLRKCSHEINDGKKYWSNKMFVFSFDFNQNNISTCSAEMHHIHCNKVVQLHFSNL